MAKPLWAAALVLLALPAAAAEPAPPVPPERDKKPLESASAVALDAAKALSFLEQGQAYYKVFSKGTHAAAENKRFIQFAEDYDRELSNLKKELEVLQLWVDKKSALKPE